MSFAFQKPYKGPLRAVVLDWAGTVVDFGSVAPVAAFVETFRRRGVAVTAERARGPMGTPKKVHIGLMLKMDEVAREWERVHARRPDQADLDSLYQEFEPIQKALLPQYADLIPGTLEAVAAFRRRGLKIGTTTGYTASMMAILAPEARKRGFEPDAIVTADQVPSGRPHPWMCVAAAMRMQVYPMQAIVKVGDTLADIEEGLNAGMWSVGVVETGNEMGCSWPEFRELPIRVREDRRAKAFRKMQLAGAHAVVDSIAQVPALLDEIAARVARGERP
ncbi:MAG: phosphonoacetaldehyde hydrolase [Acidobacteria bacterium]|nr:phosphonoacetaldehyde hydrolase [Acidobacteriota bacterium]MBI3473889.1 phosphonoacetaldehyde hydrolase [Candidatus Solibacter usitatus]